ncbi:MAG TPA: hypothetical protein VHC49_10755 [Mycobacteriales bacterium]|nr:hypothetical protein [Mycobacteriales bacterium]
MTAAGPSTPPVRPVLIWCTLASLGVLFLKQDIILSTISARSALSYQFIHVTWISYVALVLPAAGLIAWQLNSRQSWPWLLVIGAAAAMPGAVLHLDPGLGRSWMSEPLIACAAISSTATLIGLLSAANWMWHHGAQAEGNALTGTALVIQVVGPVVLLTLWGAHADIMRWLNIVLPALALAGSAAVPVLTRATTGARPAGPSWPVTATGGLAATAPLLFYVWQPDLSTPPRTLGDVGAVADRVADYYLYVGLTFFAVGLVLGLLLGRRILLAAAASGILMAALGMLIVPAVEVLIDYVLLTVVAAAFSVIIGFVLARTRWRAQIGMTGLGVIGIGLVVLAVLFNSDRSFDSYYSFTEGLTPPLVIIGIIAAITALAAVGSAVAEDGAAPAALAGLATPFTLGTIAIIVRFEVDVAPDKAPLAGVLPPAAAAFFLVVILIAGLVGPRRSSQAPLLSASSSAS